MKQAVFKPAVKCNVKLDDQSITETSCDSDREEKDLFQLNMLFSLFKRQDLKVRRVKLGITA